MNLTSPADTLVCDTAQIALWQSDPAYNYNCELITPEMNSLSGSVGSLGSCCVKYSAVILLKSIQGLSWYVLPFFFCC